MERLDPSLERRIERIEERLLQLEGKTAESVDRLRSDLITVALNRSTPSVTGHRP